MMEVFIYHRFVWHFIHIPPLLSREVFGTFLKNLGENVKSLEAKPVCQEVHLQVPQVDDVVDDGELKVAGNFQSVGKYLVDSWSLLDPFQRVAGDETLDANEPEVDKQVHWRWPSRPLMQVVV